MARETVTGARVDMRTCGRVDSVLEALHVCDDMNRTGFAADVQGPAAGSRVRALRARSAWGEGIVISTSRGSVYFSPNDREY